jgi:hypothetical protein
MNEALAAAFLIVGGWGVFKSVRAIARGHRSRTWPVTSGEIRKTKVITKKDSEGDDVSRRDVEYAYTVAAKKYRGRRVRFGVPTSLLWSGTPPPPLRRGARIDVIHDPSDPAVSALERGFSPFALLTLAGASTLVAMGVRILWR